MGQKNSGLAQALKKYKSGWVSVAPNYKRVVASGKTLRDLLAKVSKLGNPRGFIMKAAPNFSNYVGA